MKDLEFSLNEPQGQFLQLPQKFKAYVGGYGCVAAETRIVTEHGLMRISEITKPMRVLSWNEKSRGFQLSLSGGAFPKGRANLYRVVTRKGEFRASGHHHIFSSGCKYEPVESLRAGRELSTFSCNLSQTMKELAPRLFSSGDAHYSKTHADLMGRYADEARRYGQRFLREEETGQGISPLPAGALGSSPYFGWPSIERRDAQEEQKQEHTRRGLFACLRRKLHSILQKPNPVTDEASHTSTSVFGRISEIRPLGSRFVERCVLHCKALRRQVVGCSFKTPFIEREKIVRVMEEERNVYYDLQVLETNNYVDEFGFIHHNSGKTFVGCAEICAHFWRHPKISQGYFAPTYPQIRDIFYPTMEEVAARMGLNVKVKVGDHEVDVYQGKRYRGTVICRSMEKPETIVGFKIGNALCDEIDILPVDKALKAWRKVIARMRYKEDGVKNGISVTTTPEGFKFVYAQFVTALRDNPELGGLYGLIQASTYDNEDNLPLDYIESLLQSYPPELVKAYLRGEFTNLTSGSVYADFSRILNHTNEMIEPREPLLIGMDFNVNNMTACINVVRNGDPRVLAERVKVRDTPTMCQILKDDYGSKGHDITIFPDASGANTSSKNASESDLSIIRQAGFRVEVNHANPAVKDRVNAYNSMILNARGERRFKINTYLAPVTTEALEQQIWEGGAPDKKAGMDHANDAQGYYIVKRFPIQKPSAQRVQLIGL